MKPKRFSTAFATRGRSRLLLLTLALAGASAHADTVYIRDVIYVPLRGGQSGEHRIIHQGIRSGTELERVEVNDETGFSRVRSKNGLEGWIQNQYLVTEPIARDRLANVEKTLQDLQNEYDQVQAQLAAATDLMAGTQDQLAGLDSDKSELNQELSRITNLAADAIQMEAQNRELQKDVGDLNQQIDDLSVMNANLQDTNNQSWYMIGAATIFLGILLGIWFGRQLFGRRDAGWG